MTEEKIEQNGAGMSLAERGDEIAERFGKSDWIELTAAFLLAMATIASAWAAYQSTRWSGNQANSYSAASAARTESVRQSNLADAERQVDVASYVAWLQAYANKQQGLMDFYQSRFRAEFQPAFDAWFGSVPAGSIPDGTRFTRPEYVLAAQTQADQFEATADASAADARISNQRSDNFVLIVVLMASVLFFAGVGTKFKGVAVRRMMISMATIVFVIGVVAIVSMPQNVGI